MASLMDHLAVPPVQKREEFDLMSDPIIDTIVGPKNNPKHEDPHHSKHFQAEIERRLASASKFVDPTNALNWSKYEVGRWVQELQLDEQYARSFAQRKVDGPMLLNCNENMLRALGVRQIHACEMMQKIYALKKTVEQSAPSNGTFTRRGRFTLQISDQKHSDYIKQISTNEHHSRSTSTHDLDSSDDLCRQITSKISAHTLQRGLLRINTSVPMASLPQDSTTSMSRTLTPTYDVSQIFQTSNGTDSGTQHTMQPHYGQFTPPTTQQHWSLLPQHPLSRFFDANGQTRNPSIPIGAESDREPMDEKHAEEILEFDGMARNRTNATNVSNASDGTVSPLGATQPLTSSVELDGRNAFEQIFDQYFDADGIGGCNHEEWLSGLERLNFESTLYQQHTLFQLMDVHSSGLVDREQFVGTMMAQYADHQHLHSMIQPIRDAIRKHCHDHNVISEWYTEQELAELRRDMADTMRSMGVPLPQEKQRGQEEMDECNRRYEELLARCKELEAVKQIAEETYEDLWALHETQTQTLRRVRVEAEEKDRLLSVWQGAVSALKKMDLHSLQELETNMNSSLQNVRDVLAKKRADDIECKVCMDHSKDTVLVPCGHCLCSKCSQRLRKCPMCRARIERSVKIR